MDYRFYYFRHLYSAGSACVLLTIIAWVAHRYGQLYLHCSLAILLGSFQLFLHSDQPLSEGENNPVQRCLPVWGGCIIHARRWWSRTDRQTALCNRRRPAATSSRRASFSACDWSNSLRVFCIERSNITLTHLHVIIAAFASFSSLAFLSRQFCR